MPFEKDLQNSRVYKRVACRSSALSLTDSARLRGMSSLFSDTTLDKVSKVSFISLPVSYKELTNSDCYETKAVSCRSLSNQGNPEGSHQREHDIFRSLVAPKADEILVVGVHVGMKSTAVSYVKIPYETEDYAMHILEWPGSNDRLVRRVPTAVTYEVGRRRNISWGFECPADCNVGSSRAVRDRFTAYLDPRMLSLAHQALTKDKFESLEDVEMWFEDFLRSLYKHTARSLTEFFKIDDWRTYKVEYAFSVPTVWEDSGTVISFFRAILERAGFGETVEHSISTELTEEEAIAKYASMDVKLQEGNILLVLNDGERSESIPAFEVISLEILKGPDGKNFKIPKLKMLKFAYGGPSYSINIDHVFEDEVKRRLKLIPEDSFPYSLQCIADGLLETFQVFVRSETEALDDFEKIELRLPFVPREFYHADARIRDGRMLFTIGEIWCMYDKSLGSLFSFLNWLKSFKQISHLVISGNRISFPYVQKRVREYLGKEAQVNLIICKCPDLAVSNGLILDRMGSITQSLSSHGNT
ncbi:uncharacterized protein K441DRAFT_666849 [Cenococcum geophilum 1.58]|uniref:uncharacterized protein n=1 Tax=Cenococcum geophilum 1.58 TaxID=794803 RepID=UPI00358E1AEE|nr:hypothetical protein K441DRAFT_666849 [Cenococcum geophilum 1.58]